MQKGYLSKNSCERLREEFGYIEDMTKNIDNERLTISIERFKVLLYRLTEGFIYKVPNNISMDGIKNYSELPKVKESVNKKINKQ